MATEEEELLLRQLPHSVEAEQAVLGSMLIDPRCVPEVIDKLRPDRSSQSGVEDFSPHDLRRTFATRLLGAGTDINLVRKAMGHASVLTTQRYDKREDEEVEEATRKILI